MRHCCLIRLAQTARLPEGPMGPLSYLLRRYQFLLPVLVAFSSAMALLK